MASADRRPGAVAELADRRVDKGIGDQGQRNCQPDQTGAKPDDLLILEKQESGEAVILDPVTDRPGTIEKLRFKRQLVRSRAQRRCSGRIASSMPGVSGSQLPRVPTSKPPSTSKWVPVTKPAASEAR